jgi:hypothetical protein
LNGDVVLDFHPEYFSITPQKSDTNITSTVFLAIFGNFPLSLQCGKPTFQENGLGTCFTMTQLQQAMSSIIPGLALSSIGFSEDILPVQDMYENEEVKGHLHKA